MSEIARSPQTAAAEYLIDVIDKILEAFHTGEGLRNNAPEPITLDIARRLIWREIRTTMRDLERENYAFPTLWLRVEDLYSRSADVPGVAHRPTPEGQRTLLALLPTTLHWNVRCYGARRDGDPTIFYVSGHDSAETPLTPARLAELLQTLRESGFEVRDFTFIDG